MRTTRGYICKRNGGVKPRLFNWESKDTDCCGPLARNLGVFKYTRNDAGGGKVAMSVKMAPDASCAAPARFADSYYPMVFHPGKTHDVVIAKEYPKMSALHFFSRHSSEWVIVRIHMNTMANLRPYIDGADVAALECYIKYDWVPIILPKMAVGAVGILSLRMNFSFQRRICDRGHSQHYSLA